MNVARRTRPTARLLAALAAAALLATGCGGEQEATPHRGGGSGADHESMAGMDMGGGGRPSEPATMICSDEIHDAVRRTFAAAVPDGTPQWKRSERTYSCSYRVPGGRLELSVQDALQESDGRAHFAGVSRDLPGARTIRGVQAVGLPAVSSPRGEVAFLKDGKTLLVDASGLASSGLPRGYDRQQVAYAVAAAVVACWTE